MMKVNQELLGYARVSQGAGIPVITGIPLVSSLLKLRIKSRCLWFDLQEFIFTDSDCFIAIATDGSIIPNSLPQGFSPRPLADSRMLTIIGQSPVLSWENAVEMLCRIRYMTPASRRFSFFGGYRPFHFVFPVS
jgi:hypothetical protein